MMSTEPSSTSTSPTEAAANKLILAVDTSSPTASFAIAHGETILASLTSTVNAPHSRTFYDHLAILLKLAGCNLKDIDAFAAATGPGSFTGLRVGLAAIKGLAHTTGKPALGINSIDALALTANVVGLTMVVINAGRKEVYNGFRLITALGLVKTVGEDTVGVLSESMMAAAQSFQLLASHQPLLILGDGALAHRNELAAYAAAHQATLRLVSRFDPQCAEWQLKTSASNTAEEIARYAGLLMNNGFAPSLHPHYIRPSDAEIKWDNGNQSTNLQH
jgi:tRNA threonylcarbamoyladenosine biosynthesis protein TsaB